MFRFAQAGILAGIVAWTLYPGGLALTLWIATEAMAAGAHPTIVVSSIPLAMGLLVFGLQYLYPHAREWQANAGDLRVDLIHAALSMGAATEIFGAVFFGALYAAAAALSGALGSSLWPGGWPLLAQFFLALFAAEFASYWVHRLSHEWPLLWPFHAIHHSPERLYLLSAGRNHPLHVVLNFGLQMTILIFLGAPSEILALKAVFTGVHGQLQHANVRMRMIPGVSWIFSTPELHRWHHSRAIAESDHNYGNILILWDVIFGSRFRPRDRSPSTDVGLPAGTRFPQSYLGQLLVPFRWKEVVAPSQAHKFI